MTPFLDDGDVRLYAGDCVEAMAGLPADSVDAIVTDPPYELGFMGRAWDGSGVAYRVETWAAALRVLKPGGHLLAFGGARTYHRMACAIEDAGFEIRDCITWHYGSGFPKSLDVSKAIDREAGAERTEVIGVKPGHEDFVTRTDAHAAGGRSDGWDRPWRDDPDAVARSHMHLAPATPEAARWAGWGTALKPNTEMIVVARKPIRERTVAQQVLATGTGALNVDGCRVPGNVPSVPQPDFTKVNGRATRLDTYARNGEMSSAAAGRWPPNLLLTHAPACEEDGACAPGCPVAEMDAQSGERPSRPGAVKRGGIGEHVYGDYVVREDGPAYPGDTGGASRFFPAFRYEAKASGADRGEGNTHPTVKPLALMRWLVRLVTPPNGTMLDPFAGSGTTLLAARQEGFRSIGIEREEEYLQMCAHRLRQLSLFA